LLKPARSRLPLNCSIADMAFGRLARNELFCVKQASRNPSMIFPSNSGVLEFLNQWAIKIIVDIRLPTPTSRSEHTHSTKEGNSSRKTKTIASGRVERGRSKSTVASLLFAARNRKDIFKICFEISESVGQKPAPAGRTGISGVTNSTNGSLFRPALLLMLKIVVEYSEAESGSCVSLAGLLEELRVSDLTRKCQS
jgi:hypothetical protein